MSLTADDQGFLRRSFEVAASARSKGNLPFGAVLVVDGVEWLAAENQVVTSGDVTRHAEIEVVRHTARRDRSVLASATLYASSEPCPMCAGAIAFSGIGRLVFAADAATVAGLIRAGTGAALPMPCREVLAGADHPIEVEGPALLEEARVVHEGYWTSA